MTEHRQDAGVFSAQGPSRNETVPTGVDGRPGTGAEKRDSWMRKGRSKRERQRGKKRRAVNERRRERRGRNQDCGLTSLKL